MDEFKDRLNKAINIIEDSEYMVIGAGAGLSTAAGIDYGGVRHVKYFSDFIEKYGFKDMYSSSFYPFKTPEEQWAYWARHIFANRYDVGKTEVYTKLQKLASDRKYFVLTTNVDHQFWINGFDDKRIFATQGDYGQLQCSRGCHDTLYDNRNLVFELLENTVDCRVPADMIPYCPVCGELMDVHLRKDSYFVENRNWHQMNERYSSFLSDIDSKCVFLEIGVGFNTPTIIRNPFEIMTYQNPDASLVRLNLDFPQVPSEIQNQSVSFDENVEDILDSFLEI